MGVHVWGAVLLMALAVGAQGHVPSSHLIDSAAGDYLLATSGPTSVSQEGLTATLASLLALPCRMAADTAREVCTLARATYTVHARFLQRASSGAYARISSCVQLSVFAQPATSAKPPY